jgi:hypothetical protein
VIIEGITVFAALFTLDFVWARYTQAITARWPWQASGYAGVIIGLSGFAAISYTTNPWMLLPAIAGAVTGTYSAVRFT